MRALRVLRALLLAACVVLAGCEQVMRDMYEQPRFDPDAATPLFDDGSVTRPPPDGSVARSRGDAAATASGRRGDEAVDDAQAAYARAGLPPITAALLARGRERFDIYCSPCHNYNGNGQGQVVQRGFPQPASFTATQRLLDAPVGYFYNAITNGFGRMYSYASRVKPEDRWAISAYIKALQLSQNAQVSDVPADILSQLSTTEAAR